MHWAVSGGPPRRNRAQPAPAGAGGDREGTAPIGPIDAVPALGLWWIARKAQNALYPLDVTYPGHPLNRYLVNHGPSRSLSSTVSLAPSPIDRTLRHSTSPR